MTTQRFDDLGFQSNQYTINNLIASKQNNNFSKWYYALELYLVLQDLGLTGKVFHYS